MTKTRYTERNIISNNSIIKTYAGKNVTKRYRMSTLAGKWPGKLELSGNDTFDKLLSTSCNKSVIEQKEIRKECFRAKSYLPESNKHSLLKERGYTTTNNLFLSSKHHKNRSLERFSSIKNHTKRNLNEVSRLFESFGSSNDSSLAYPRMQNDFSFGKKPKKRYSSKKNGTSRINHRKSSHLKGVSKIYSKCKGIDSILKKNIIPLLKSNRKGSASTPLNSFVCYTNEMTNKALSPILCNKITITKPVYKTPEPVETNLPAPLDPEQSVPSDRPVVNKGEELDEGILDKIKEMPSPVEGTGKRNSEENKENKENRHSNRIVSRFKGGKSLPLVENCSSTSCNTESKSLVGECDFNPMIISTPILKRVVRSGRIFSKKSVKNLKLSESSGVKTSKAVEKCESEEIQCPREENLENSQIEEAGDPVDISVIVDEAKTDEISRLSGVSYKSFMTCDRESNFPQQFSELNERRSSYCTVLDHHGDDDSSMWISGISDNSVLFENINNEEVFYGMSMSEFKTPANQTKVKSYFRGRSSIESCEDDNITIDVSSKSTPIVRKESDRDADNNTPKTPKSPMHMEFDEAIGNDKSSNTSPKSLMGKEIGEDESSKVFDEKLGNDGSSNSCQSPKKSLHEDSDENMHNDWSSIFHKSDRKVSPNQNAVHTSSACDESSEDYVSMDDQACISSIRNKQFNEISTEKSDAHVSSNYDNGNDSSCHAIKDLTCQEIIIINYESSTIHQDESLVEDEDSLFNAEKELENIQDGVESEKDSFCDKVGRHVHSNEDIFDDECSDVSHSDYQDRTKFLICNEDTFSEDFGDFSKVVYGNDSKCVISEENEFGDEFVDTLQVEDGNRTKSETEDEESNGGDFVDTLQVEDGKRTKSETEDEESNGGDFVDTLQVEDGNRTKSETEDGNIIESLTEGNETKSTICDEDEEYGEEPSAVYEHSTATQNSEIDNLTSTEYKERESYTSGTLFPHSLKFDDIVVSRTSPDPTEQSIVSNNEISDESSITTEKTKSNQILDLSRVTMRRKRYSLKPIMEDEDLEISNVTEDDGYGYNGTCRENTTTTSTMYESRRSIYLPAGKKWRRTFIAWKNMQEGCNDESPLATKNKGRNWAKTMEDLINRQNYANSPGSIHSQLFTSSYLPIEHSTFLDNYNYYEHPTIRASSVTISEKRARFSLCGKSLAGTDTKDNDFLNTLRMSMSTSSESITSSNESNVDLTINLEDENFEAKVESTPKDVVLNRCKQNEPLMFADCFPDSVLKKCRKIGEGLYGEVFMLERKRGQSSVLKIIPIEGSQLVNGEKQKTFQEIVSEIVIAQELSNLKNGANYVCGNFCAVRKCWCVQGRYPGRLIQLWKDYDYQKGSDNDCPNVFEDKQLYIVLELKDGGEPLDLYKFSSARQSVSIFNQVAFSLAVAEESLQFEHRDMHWGNVLVSKCKHKEVIFKIDGKTYKVKTHGVKAMIIDFTLSRINYKGYTIYNNLALDPELFTAEGDFQFEVYRMMKKEVNNEWDRYSQKTNVFWLYYTVDKMVNQVQYRRVDTKIHKEQETHLKWLKDKLLDYDSALALCCTIIR